MDLIRVAHEFILQLHQDTGFLWLSSISLGSVTERLRSAQTNKQTFWCIRADVVRKLDRGEPEPETLASGSAASSEALDAPESAPF